MPKVRVSDIPQKEGSGEMAGLAGNDRKNGFTRSGCKTVIKTLCTGPHRAGQSAQRCTEITDSHGRIV